MAVPAGIEPAPPPSEADMYPEPAHSLDEAGTKFHSEGECPLFWLIDPIGRPAN